MVLDKVFQEGLHLLQLSLQVFLVITEIHCMETYQGFGDRVELFGEFLDDFQFCLRELLVSAKNGDFDNDFDGVFGDFCCIFFVSEVQFGDSVRRVDDF